MFNDYVISWLIYYIRSLQRVGLLKMILKIRMMPVGFSNFSQAFILKH